MSANNCLRQLKRAPAPLTFNEWIIADSAVYSSLSVEVSALGAFVIHLAREQVCEECAQNQDSSEHDEGQ